jgi:hypothetical protein
MTGIVHLGEIDPLSEADAQALAQHETGPCVSIFLPTHRAGPQVQQDPIRLRNLLDEADANLAGAGIEPKAAEDLLAPWRALLTDAEFWRHQADGLALYAAPGFHRRYRVPLVLDDAVVVGSVFRIRPLLRLVSSDGVAFVLALSQNEVRLYEMTRSTLSEAALGSTPRSMAEALRYEDPERQLQLRSTGRETVQFHGHGAGAEVDKEALERFLRAVDRGLEEVLGADRHPLVLAAVGYYAPILRSVSRHPRIVDAVVEGNPEGLGPPELHARAWPLVEPALLADRTRTIERYREAPTSRVMSDPAGVVGAAREGRVESLLVSADTPVWGSVDDDGTVTTRVANDPDAIDLVDHAVVEALRTGATVHTAESGELEADVDMVALLRF